MTILSIKPVPLNCRPSVWIFFVFVLLGESFGSIGQEPLKPEIYLPVDLAFAYVSIRIVSLCVNIVESGLYAL